MTLSGASLVAELSAPTDDGGSIPTAPLQLRKSDWVVAGCDQDIAERFIIETHYAKGASNTARPLPFALALVQRTRRRGVVDTADDARC